MHPAIEQFHFLIYELRRESPFRLLISPVTYIHITYRCDRAGFFLFGKRWRLLRICLLPLRIFSHMMGAAFEIAYGANIGKGFSIWHPCLGVVIHSDAKCGDNLQLAGGNVLYTAS